jgi:two-component system chemotaxis sensor kinase CheA
LNLQAELVTEGDTVQVDKVLVERLLDPLLHLVRNALSHGIEPATERLAAGKAALGTIRLRAASAGDVLVLSVEDDGRGIDVRAVRDRALQLGWDMPSGEMSLADALGVLCRPGFSTRTQADVGAGRGVGLDVVQSVVRGLGGNLTLESAAGRFTRFTLRLPLNLVIVEVMLVQLGTETYAVPRAEVDAAIFVDAGSVARVSTGELVSYQSGALPLIRLGPLLQAPGAATPESFYALVVKDGGQGYVLAVDRLMGMQEAMVRTIQDPLLAQPGVSGATELGTGQQVLILSLPDLIRSARWRSRERAPI